MANKLIEHIEKKEWNEAKMVFSSDEGLSMAKEVDIHGRLPLHLAIAHRGPDELILSLIHGYDDAITKGNYNDWTPLHYAIYVGGTSFEVIEAMILKHPEVLDITDHNDETPRDFAKKYDTLDNRAMGAVLRSTQHWKRYMQMEDVLTKVIEDKYQSKIDDLERTIEMTKATSKQSELILLLKLKEFEQKLNGLTDDNFSCNAKLEECQMDVMNDDLSGRALVHKSTFLFLADDHWRVIILVLSLINVSFIFFHIFNFRQINKRYFPSK